MAALTEGLAQLLLALALLGCVYTLAAAWLMGGYRPRAVSSAPPMAVSILKPLHGVEPRLRANLETLFAQRYAAPVQIVFGVARGDDAAVATVALLQSTYPSADISLIVDATRHGASAKVSNVINMVAHAKHPMLVLADSDVAWGPDTLERLAAALAEPGVGLASCLHSGRGDAGFWSVLGAMDISYRFMPSVVIGCATGLACPTLGPTMAFTRQTLDAVGGFAILADVLADDYALGEAVRGLGLATVIPRFTIVHSGDETGFAALVRHELRWTRTIFGIDSLGFIGSGVTHCLALAVAGAALGGFGMAGLAIVNIALASRLILALRVDAVTETHSGSLFLLPLRDLLSAAIYLATPFVRDVTWRGSRYRVSRTGRISATQRT